MPTWNRVPKGAQQSLAEFFQKLLTELLRDPTDANKWLHLLTMPKQCLKQPTRGGKKYNLTAHLRKQIRFPQRALPEYLKMDPAAQPENASHPWIPGLAKRWLPAMSKEQYGQCAQTTALLQTQRKPCNSWPRTTHDEQRPLRREAQSIHQVPWPRR